MTIEVCRVEVVGVPCYFEGVGFAVRIGFLVEGDCVCEGSAGDVAPLLREDGVLVRVVCWGWIGMLN